MTYSPFPIWYQSDFSCLILTVGSLPAYRFLKRQVRWSGITISLRIFHSLFWSTQSKSLLIHTVKVFGTVSKAEVDIFLELCCFFDDTMGVCNFISGSSAFSKSSLSIWKFMVLILLKPGLENFEHYFTSMWDECNCAVVLAFFGTASFWDRWVMVERSNRMWCTGAGSGKPLQYSCLENPMNSMKRQNDRIPKEELPRSLSAQYATGDQWRNNSRKNEGMEPK